MLETYNFKRENMEQQNLNNEPNPLKLSEFEWIVSQRKAGRNCQDLAQELNAKGYTAKGGGQLWACDVSQFCIKLGYREKNPARRKQGRPRKIISPVMNNQPADAALMNQAFSQKVSGGVDSFLGYVTRTQDLNSSQKAKVLQLFI